MRSHLLRVCLVAIAAAAPLGSTDAATSIKAKQRKLSNPASSSTIWYKAPESQGIVRIGMKRIEPRPDGRTRPGQPLTPTLPAQPSAPIQPVSPPANSSLGGTSIGVSATTAEPMRYLRFTANVSYLRSAQDVLYGVSGEAESGQIGASPACFTGTVCSAHALVSARISGVVGYQLHQITPYLMIGRVVTSFSGMGTAADSSFSKAGWTYSGGLRIPINVSWSGDVEIRRDQYDAMPSSFGGRSYGVTELRLGVRYNFAPIDARR
jgi:opacity protein-like surface antigen